MGQWNLKWRIAARGAPALLVVCLLWLNACDRSPAPPTPAPPTSASQPAAPPAPTPNPTPAPVLEASNLWSADEARAKLADEDLTTRRSAAVRLVRLARVRPLIAPTPLPDDLAASLDVLAASDDFVLGLRVADCERALRAPVLIQPDGHVRLLADGAAEEVTMFVASADTDLFPHLVLSPWDARLLGDPNAPALVTRAIAPARFDVIDVDGFARLALVLPHDDGDKAAIAAHYDWDIFEEMFTGPAMDHFPEPFAGKFQLDLKASAALIPVGGELPEPEPVDNTPPAPPQPAQPIIPPVF